MSLRFLLNTLFLTLSFLQWVC